MRVFIPQGVIRVFIIVDCPCSKDKATRWSRNALKGQIKGGPRERTVFTPGDVEQNSCSGKSGRAGGWVGEWQPLLIAIILQTEVAQTTQLFCSQSSICACSRMGIASSATVRQSMIRMEFRVIRLLPVCPLVTVVKHLNCCEWQNTNYR